MKHLKLLFAIFVSLFVYENYYAQNFPLSECSPSNSVIYGPMYSSTTDNYKNRMAFILPANQLTAMGGGTLTSTYFKRATASGALGSGSTFKIYLKNVTISDFGSGSLTWATEIAGATLVFDADPQNEVGTSDGFKEFVHTNTTPFVYTAGGNLAVYVEYTQTTGPASAINWYYEFNSPCIDENNDNTSKYTNTTGTLSTTLGTSNYRRPTIGFDFIPAPVTTPPSCANITYPANGAVNAYLPVTMTWLAALAAEGYKISVGSTSGATDIMPVTNVGNVASYQFTTLSPGNTYYVNLVPTNSLGDATGCTEWIFTVPAIPANDNCSAAVPLSVNSNLTCASPTAGTTLGATDSGVASSCTSGNPDDDVWYSFVATSAVHQVALENITSVGVSTSTTLYTEVFSGSCAGTSLICDTTDASPTEVATTPGETYYVRVYTSQAGGNYATSFDICILTPPPPPANDNCAGAISLAVNAGTTCASPTNGTTVSATTSPDALTPCTGTADDDVWYSFVATSSSHLISLSNIVSAGTGTSTSIYTQVLTGSCGSLSNVICDTTDDSPTVVVTTPGQTYYVRVYTSNTNTATLNYAVNFDICILTQTIPTNDECATSTVLAVSPDTTCTTLTSGTTEWATDSGLSATACSASAEADDDVWYSFVATNPIHFVTVSNVVSVGTTSSTSLYTQVYSGTCSTLTSVLCDTSYSSPTILTNLTVGSTYYIRIFNSNGGSNYANTFDICITTPPPPPANDECAGAISLTVNPDDSCAVIASGNTLGATDSGLAVTPCTGTADDDIWYSFTALGTSHYIALSNVVATGTTTATTIYMQAFTGSCGGLTSLACSTNKFLLLNTLTVGQVYYVRIYSSAAIGNHQSFDICVGTPAAAPTNDECDGAISMTVNPDMNCGVVTSGTTAWATASAVTATTCAGTEDDDVWYSFTATSNTHTIQLNNIVSIGTNSSTSLNMELMTGTCSGLTNVACSTNKFMNLGGLTIGQVYYLRVYNTSTGTGLSYANTFDICVGTPASTAAPANDACGTATAIAAFPYSFIQQDGIFATNNSGSISECNASNDGVWYSVVGDGGTITVDLETTTPWDPQLTVYTGTCGTFTCVDYVDATGNVTGSLETISFPSVAGTTYYLNISYFASTDNPEGNFEINVTSSTLGTAEIVKETNVSIYPNPFSEFVYIDKIREVKLVTIVDMSGRLIKKIVQPSTELRLGDLKQGVYLFMIEMKDGTRKSVKMIKK